MQRKCVLVKRKCVRMAIAPVSSSLVSTVNRQNNVAVDKKAAPEAVQPQQVQNTKTGEALRSYFLGGNAVSFGFNCSTGSFVTKKMQDVPCCCCGGRMILQKDLNSVAKSFARNSGEQLAEKINQDKDYFRSNQGAIAGMIATEAAQNPRLDAKGAVAKINGDFNGKLKNYCSNVLTSTDKIAKEQLGEENPVSQIIAQEQKKVAQGKIDRISFTEKLVGLHEQGSIEHEAYDAIINSAMQLPQNAEMARKHFNKIQGKDNTGIFNELLKESTQTIEHVHPHSKGGPNDTDNYLAECGECNHPRGNMSYLKWIKVHPEYPVNAQKHIEWFQQKVVDGQIDKRYDDYGTKIKETLSKESNGKMELKVLDKQKIQEMRNDAIHGRKADVSEEIKEQEEQKKYNKKAA